MVKITAATVFLGKEGMWRSGDTREVSDSRAAELIELGFAIEAQAAAETLQQAPEGDAAEEDTEIVEDAEVEDAEKPPKPGEDRKIKPATGPKETK